MVKKKIPKYSQLARLGIPALMIPGIIWASIYGTSYWKKITNYYQNSNLFPISGVVAQVEDGDTFTLTSGQKVRMTGINAPDKGKPGFDESKEFAQTNMEGKKVWLEYDRYQDDKYGRLLAWVWLNCETLSPKFLPATYMYVSKSESKEYLTQKPIGCQKGTLFNQTLVSQNQAEAIDYSGRGRLKYKL